MSQKPTFSQMPGHGRPKLPGRTELTQSFAKTKAAKSGVVRATSTTVVIQQAPPPTSVPLDVPPAEVGTLGLVELSDAPENGISTALTPNARVVQPFGASGTDHAAGIVPDPGGTAGTTKFLREDGTWNVPPGGGGGGGSSIVVTQKANVVTYGNGYQSTIGLCTQNGYFFTDKSRTDDTTYQVAGGTSKPAYPETLSSDTLATGLITAFMLNEGSGTTVTGSDGRTGTLSGTTFTTTPDGTGVSLSGTDNIIMADTGFPVGNLDRTVVMRVKVAAPFANYYSLFNYGNYGGGNQDWFWLLGAGSNVLFTQYGASASSATPLNDGLWHTLIFTSDSSSNQTLMYLDGVVDLTYGGALNTVSNGYCTIGSVNGYQSQNVEIEFCYVYDRVLTSTEIATLQVNSYVAFSTLGNALTALYDFGAGVVTDAVTALFTPLWENDLTMILETSPNGGAPVWTSETITGTLASNGGMLASQNFSAALSSNPRWIRLSIQDSAGIVALGSFFIIGADGNTIGAYDP